MLPYNNQVAWYGTDDQPPVFVCPPQRSRYGVEKVLSSLFRAQWRLRLSCKHDVGENPDLSTTSSNEIDLMAMAGLRRG